jgi:hypothetical protein
MTFPETLLFPLVKMRFAGLFARREHATLR